VRVTCRCGATWTGTSRQHCPACHQTFDSTLAGDRHRVGPFNPPGLRRCLTVSEIRLKGMTPDHEGAWGYGEPGRKRPLQGAAAR
jgi:hypothetical protein